MVAAIPATPTSRLERQTPMADGMTFNRYVYWETDELLRRPTVFDVKEEMPYQGDGYMVELFGDKIPAEEFKPDSIQRFLDDRSVSILLDQPGYYLKTSIPHNSDYAYLDVVRILPSVEEAEAVARRFNEARYYDFRMRDWVEVS